MAMKQDYEEPLAKSLPRILAWAKELREFTVVGQKPV